MTCTFFIECWGCTLVLIGTVGSAPGSLVGMDGDLSQALHHLTLCPEPTEIVRKRKEPKGCLRPLYHLFNWVPWKQGNRTQGTFFGEMISESIGRGVGRGREAKRDQAGCNNEQVTPEQLGLWGSTLRGCVEEILKLKYYQNHLEGLQNSQLGPPSGFLIQ